MTDKPVGRIAHLEAQKALDHALTQACVDPGIVPWAVEQLRHQAVMHVKTMGPATNRAFLAKMATAIKTLETMLASVSEVQGIGGDADVR